MFIDVHCHPTNCPDQAWAHGGSDPFTAEKLIKLLDGPFTVCGKERKIEYAVVQPPPGNTVWINGQPGGKEGIRNYMAYIREIVKKYPDRLIGCFNYNPRFGVEECVSELIRHVKENGFKMIKIHSNFHSYRPDRRTDWLFPAAETAGKLKIPVMIHTGDPPFSIPSQFYPVIDRFPDVTFILAHFGNQMGVNYMYDAAWMTKKSDNVLVETGWCWPAALVEFAELLGPEKMILGSDSPPNEPWSWVRMVEVLTWNYPQGCNMKEEDMEKILGDNIAPILGLKKNAKGKTRGSR